MCPRLNVDITVSHVSKRILIEKIHKHTRTVAAGPVGCLHTVRQTSQVCMNRAGMWKHKHRVRGPINHVIYDITHEYGTLSACVCLSDNLFRIKLTQKRYAAFEINKIFYFLLPGVCNNRVKIKMISICRRVQLQ